MSEIVATASEVRTDVRSVSVQSRSSQQGFSATLERLRDFAEQPAVRRARPALGLLGLVGAGALVWSMLAQPAQRDLFRGLADADKAAASDALGSAGIPYQIDRDSGALTVSESDYYQAKMLLAQQGLPKAAPSGEDMLGNLPLGASRAVEGERLRGAREQDLARTIEAIDAVATARVHLATEQPSVFLRDQKQAAASVMLKLQPGRSLTDAQVGAIASLVSSSVPGLAADAVSIVDQSGRLLSRGAGDAASAAADRQVSLQAQVETRYAEALDRLLTPLVGAGNYTAEVHADLNFDETQATRESYPKDLQVVRAENGGWTKEGGPDGPAIGIPGALSNTAPAASTLTATNPAQPPAPGQPGAAQPGAAQPGTTAAAVAEGRTTENYTRTYELGREVSVTRNQQGSVKRLSVAVAIKDGAGKERRTAAEIAAIEQLVRGAVGADQARGDLIAVSARKFAATDEAADAGKWWEAPWVPMVARNVSALLVALLLVFGIGRPLLKRRGPAPSKPAKADKAAKNDRAIADAAEKGLIGKEIAPAIADSPVSNPSDVTLDMIESAPGYEARAALIRNFVKQDPARAALVVRDLIKSDAGRGDANG
jgi:flagellar M-ring protein FliF